MPRAACVPCLLGCVPVGAAQRRLRPGIGHLTHLKCGSGAGRAAVVQGVAQRSCLLWLNSWGAVCLARPLFICPLGNEARVHVSPHGAPAAAPSWHPPEPQWWQALHRRMGAGHFFGLFSSIRFIDLTSTVGVVPQLLPTSLCPYSRGLPMAPLPPGAAQYWGSAGGSRAPLEARS